MTRSRPRYSFERPRKFRTSCIFGSLTRTIILIDTQLLLLLLRSKFKYFSVLNLMKPFLDFILKIRLPVGKLL